MKKLHAGFLVYRFFGDEPQVLIGHPGGPFYAKKDQGVWSIPKGEYDEGEDPLDTAKREFEEEIGHPVPGADYLDLGEVKRKDGAVISIWAAEGDIDTSKVKSNTFELEWPPKSGKKQRFPELDKAEWFGLPAASQKLHEAQVEFLRRLAEHLGAEFSQPQSPKPKQNSLF